MTKSFLIDFRLGLDVDDDEEVPAPTAEEAAPAATEGASTSAMEEID
jgi:molecular chaperone HtpG